MSISRADRKYPTNSESIINKLAVATTTLNRCEAESKQLDSLKVRHSLKVKQLALLLSLYKTRFILAFAINIVIFSLLAIILIGTPPEIEIMMLAMFNFSVFATLLLSSMMASCVLNKMEKLDREADELCQDIKGFVSDTNA